MMMGDDMALVREFAANNSEPAFAALVERHIGLVHSAALRQVGDAHLAGEITQAVFIILARKAASLGPKTVLAAWLYRTTRYAAADALRARRRRQFREQEAFMQSTLNQPDLSHRSENEADAWTQLAPLLDDAMAELGETDRTVLVLRYFENKTAREIAAALRMEENAAQKRVTRALEKLRARFVKRGLTLTATVIGGAVAANSVQAAPTGLAVKVSVVAAKGMAVTTSITTLVKGTMKTKTWLKIKFAIGIGAMTLLVGSTATIVFSGNFSSSTSSEIQSITNREQVLITTFFLKIPTSKVDAIIADFAILHGPYNPNSKIFQDLLKQYPDVEFFGSPRIINFSGGQASMSVTKQVQVSGTNADIGITLDATPTVLADSRISLKIQYELRELVSGISPEIKTTKQIAQPPPFKSGGTTAIRTKISDDGQTIGKNSNNEAETLLVFVNAMIVKERLQNIITRAPK